MKLPAKDQTKNFRYAARNTVYEYHPIGERGVYSNERAHTITIEDVMNACSAGQPSPLPEVEEQEDWIFEWAVDDIQVLNVTETS